jgi:hypothetical protein
MAIIGWIAAGILLLAAITLAALLFKKKSAGNRQRQLIDAQQHFHRMREQLEAKFLTKAGATGKPRGLRWADCEFENEVTYARDRQSGVLSAFVAVTIKFEAVEGGGMEEVEAVGNAKYATAVFYFDPKHRWMTEGRAIFNLNPDEAVRRFEATLEPIGHNIV